VVLELVREGKECAVSELAARFWVSEMTIHLDLDTLAFENTTALRLYSYG